LDSTGKVIEPDQLKRYKKVFLGIARRRGQRGGWRYYDLGIPLSANNYNRLQSMVQWHLQDIQNGFYPKIEQRYTPVFRRLGARFAQTDIPANALVEIGFYDSKRKKTIWPTRSTGEKQTPQRYSAKLIAEWERWLADAKFDRVLWYEIYDIRDSGAVGKRHGMIAPGVDGEVKAAPILGEWETDRKTGKLLFSAKKKGPFWQNHIVEILSQKSTVSVVHQFKPRKIVLTPEETKGRTIAQCLQGIILDVAPSEIAVVDFSARIDTRDGKITSGPFSFSGRGDELKWIMATQLAHGFWSQGATYTELTTLNQFAAENQTNWPDLWDKEDPLNEAVNDNLLLTINIHDGLAG